MFPRPWGRDQLQPNALIKYGGVYSIAVKVIDIASSPSKAIRFPSGLKCTVLTEERLVRTEGGPAGESERKSGTFHNFTGPLTATVARRFPSGLNSANSVSFTRSNSCPVRASHTRELLFPCATRRPPSKLKVRL